MHLEVQNGMLELHDPELWRSSISLSNTQLGKFMIRIENKYSQNFELDYFKLHRWSCEYYPEFWAEFWAFCEVKASVAFEEVIDRTKKISEFPQWFTGARLNFAENLLRWADVEPKKPAFYFAGEKLPNSFEKLSFLELKKATIRYAKALRALGVREGDRVCGYLPNCFECVIAMLATASLGAVWSSTSPDFGVLGVLERLSQVQPKILLTVEAVKYNGKSHDHLEKAEEVVKKLPSIEKVIIIPFLQETVDEEILRRIPHSISLVEFLSLSDDHSSLSSGDDSEFVFAQVPFNHPLFILFSSGTTGPPKCIVHSAGGTLLKHLEEHRLQLDVTPSDCILFYTTAGWMMWNWLLSALAVGASIVLYDGSPFLPSPSRLFDLVDQIGITMLGMGAKCYAIMEEKGLRPKETHSLGTLRCLMSTGSPLKPTSFDFIYRDVKDDLLLASISGGSDIIACFMGGTWALPVHRGEIQCPLLGCDIEAWDDEGNRMIGERGELICKTPFPSMPTHFLDDPGRQKYHKAYFAKFAGVWAHGDFLIVNPRTGGYIMLGRSDGTLNPGGVRFGSAEIYQVVECFGEISDSVCVGQKWGDDERVILFVKMVDDRSLTDQLIDRLRSAIRQQLSARHVPAVIMQIGDIPYTTNGKKVEVAVKQILNGEPVKNRTALANPDALDLYQGIPNLSSYR